MLIDFHTHLFPDTLAARTLPRLSEICDSAPYYTDGTVRGTLEAFDTWGVDHGIVLNIATRDGQQHTINTFAQKVQEENPRLSCFGTIYPNGDRVEMIEELHFIKESGLRGVKLHPDYQNFFVNEERYFPLYEKMAALCLPVTFHVGWDPFSPEIVHAPSAQIAAVAKMLPKLTIIAAHMGGLQRYEEADTFLAGLPNVYLDTAIASTFCTPVQFERLIRRHGIDRILFATDLPWSTVPNELALLEKTTFLQDEKDKITSLNACRLLGIDIN